MEDLHRELLKKRQKYLSENIILEEGLLEIMKDKGLFTASMLQAILAETDTDKQMTKMLDMIPKRGPEAYRKFLDCLVPDYPWIVTNLTEKEEELVNGKGKPDVVPEVRRVIRDYVKELARTTRINIAQSKAIEDFLCRHITIDTNLTSAHVPGPKLFGIHKKVISAIPITSLDESDQSEINSILPENVTVDRIEKEITMLVHRVNEIQAIIDSCYETLGETKDKDLPDLIYSLRKLYLEREIRIEEVKSQLASTTRQLKQAKDKSRRAQELSLKSVEEKEELQTSLDSLKTKIHKLQDERQRMGMRVAFDVPTSAMPTSPNSSRRRSIRERAASAKDPSQIPHKFETPNQPPGQTSHKSETSNQTHGQTSHKSETSNHPPGQTSHKSEISNQTHSQTSHKSATKAVVDG